MRPTDDQLRRFLLGTLTQDDAETVGRWVESAPDAADALARLDTPDTLAAALERGGGTPFPDGPDVAAQLERLGEAVGGLDGTPAISGYEITGELARGGMGRVYAARDLRLDREVAIKTLLPGADPARFVTESKITARLPHPGIPPVHALGLLADGTPYLAMKLVRGRTLEAWLASRPSPSDDRPALVQVFEQVAQAVGFAHAQGVIHRDLKPLNVMVGAFGEVQVMDWGLARALASGGRQPPGAVVNQGADAPRSPDADLTHAGTVMGTPSYMAPEQARGEAVDARADVFALGAMLAAVLTGKPAFVAETGREAVAMSAAGELAPAFARLDASGADAELVALAKRCMAAGAADRPADGRAVAAEVAAYRAGVESRLRQAETTAAEATVREAEGWKRRRVLLVAAGVLVVVLAGGVIGTGIGLLQAHEAKEAEGRRANGEQVAKEEAVRQQAKAEQAEEDALAALRASTDDAIEKLIGSKDELGPQELAYLEAARERWQAFADRKGDDERSRSIRGEGHLRVGTLWEQLGRRTASKQEYQQSLEIRRQLIADFPESASYQYELARVQTHLGGLLLGQGERSEAEVHIRDAVVAFDRLATHHPAELAYQRGLGNAHLQLGNLLNDSGQMAAAEEEIMRALECRRTLAKKFPKVAEYRAEFAATLNSFGCLLDKLRRPEASEQFCEAVQIQQVVVDDFPNVPRYRHSLAAAHHDLGLVLWKEGKPMKAADEFRTARTMAGKLVADFPSIPRYRRSLANFHNSLAVVLSDVGDHGGAEKELNRAIDQLEQLIKADPKVPDHYRGLAAMLTNRSRALVSLGSVRAAAIDLTQAAVAQAAALRLDPVGTGEHIRDSAATIRDLKVAEPRSGSDSLTRPSREVLPPPKMVKE